MRINVKNSEYTAPEGATKTYKNLGSINGYSLAEPVEFVGDADNTNTYLLTFQRGNSYKKKMWFKLPEFKSKGDYAHKSAEKHIEMFIALITPFAEVYMSVEEMEARLQGCIDSCFAEKISPTDLDETVNFCLKCIWETLIAAIHETDFLNTKGYLFMCKTAKSQYPNIAIWSNLTRRLYYIKTPKYAESLDCNDFVDCDCEILDSFYPKKLNVQFSFQKHPHCEIEISGLVNGKFSITENIEVVSESEVELDEVGQPLNNEVPTWVTE